MYMKNSQYIILFLVLLQLVMVSTFSPKSSDLPLYANYAKKMEYASANNMSIYALHKQVLQKETLTAEDELEYPYYALLLIATPLLFIDKNLDIKELKKSYGRSFRLILFLVQMLVLFLMFFAFAKGVGQGAISDKLKIVLYLCLSLILFSFYFERIDLVVAGLILGSFLTLTMRRVWTAFLLLGFAVNLKLAPFILAPFWVVGALLKKDFSAYGTMLKALTVRTLQMFAAIVIFMLPLYLMFGWAFMDYLAYHIARPIQIESTYANGLLLYDLISESFTTSIFHTFSSFSLKSTLTDVLTGISSWLAALSLTILFCVFALQIWKVSLQGNKSAEILIEGNVNFFLCYVMGALVVLFLTAKVLSPQYIIWILPIAVLFKGSLSQEKIFWTLLVSLVCLTTVIFPWIYRSEIIGYTVAEGQVMLQGPSSLGVFVLTLRNGLFVMFLFYLLQVVRRHYLEKISSYCPKTL